MVPNQRWKPFTKQAGRHDCGDIEQDHQQAGDREYPGTARSSDSTTKRKRGTIEMSRRMPQYTQNGERSAGRHQRDPDHEEIENVPGVAEETTTEGIQLDQDLGDKYADSRRSMRLSRPPAVSIARRGFQPQRHRVDEDQRDDDVLHALRLHPVAKSDLELRLLLHISLTGCGPPAPFRSRISIPAPAAIESVGYRLSTRRVSWVRSGRCAAKDEHRDCLARILTDFHFIVRPASQRGGETSSPFRRFRNQVRPGSKGKR